VCDFKWYGMAIKTKYKQMKDRIVQFLASEGLSPAEFADKIGVQRSSMSHILNGRNQPSASFLQKMFQIYPLLNPRWLMIGDGAMNLVLPEYSKYPDTYIASSSLQQPATGNNPVLGETTGSHKEKGLFSDLGSDIEVISNAQTTPVGSTVKREQPKPVYQYVTAPSNGSEEIPKGEESSNLTIPSPVVQTEERDIEQILFFYKDKTFRIYRPS